MTALLLLASASAQSAPADASKPTYKYIRVGNNADKVTKPTPGIAMMGGGKDLDAAFAWLCKRANGGDLLVLRATGTDAYNPYLQGICSLNSVATLIIPDAAAAHDPFVAETIREAEAVFISGGDQSNYIKYWQHTPVQDAINDKIKSGAPIGGTSAGLAVLSQFVFTALNDSAVSKQVLADPYDKTVTIGDNFIHLPVLNGIITDQHFAKRDRFGRFVVFLARILQDGMSPNIKGIAVDEGNAVLVDEKGQATVVGAGTAYFIRPTGKPEACKAGTLVFKNLTVYRINSSGTFDLNSWKGANGNTYEVSAAGGVLSSDKADRSVY